MNPLIEGFERSTALFGERVAAVGADDWTNETPCTEWNVHDLVNHLVYELVWVPPLLAGRTIEEVGDKFDGDLLGDDPRAVYEAACTAALASARADGELENIVHLSFGDFPSSVYIGQLVNDLVLHAWDLAKGIGYDTDLPEDLVHACYEGAKPMEAMVRASGLFADPVDVGDEASLKEKYLGFFGRQA